MCDKFVQDANDCHQMLSHRMQSDGPRTKSGPHMYFISSVLFFFIELSANMERQENSLKTLVSSFSPREKNKNKSCSSSGPTISNMATFNWFCTNSHDCLFPLYCPSPACFHLDWNSFSLPFPISLHCFLTAYLSHMFILSNGNLCTTTVLNCPTNVIVGFPSSGWEWMHKCSNLWPYFCCSKSTDWL